MIYCINCNHFHDSKDCGEHGVMSAWCSCKDARIYTDTPVERTWHIESPYTINQNNNCKYYEEKRKSSWIKFIKSVF